MPPSPHRRLRSGAALVVAALIGSAIALPARAAPEQGDVASEAEARKEASERFRRGVALYKDGDFVAALVEFKRAYELEPNYRVLYNLGQTSRGLKDYAAALGAYEQYLEEGGDEIAAARRKEVEDSIDDLKKRVGTLTIITNEEGAEIQVDDVVVGVAPLEAPVVVNVGRRRVVATLPGHAPAQRVIEVAGTDELEVELALENLEGDRPLPPPPPPPPPPSNESTTPVAGIVALSITGVSAIVTGVLGGLAFSAQSDLDEALAAFPGDSAAIEDAQGRTSTFATGTDIMLGVTGACAVTTIILFVVDPGSGSDADPSAATGEDVAISLAPTPSGLWISGTF